MPDQPDAATAGPRALLLHLVCGWRSLAVRRGPAGDRARRDHRGRRSHRWIRARKATSRAGPACRHELSSFALGDTTSSISKDPSPFRFADIREKSGIDFVHVSGMTRQKHYPTAFGSGVAMLDYDGDGRLDLYFATCTTLPPRTAQQGPTSSTGTSATASSAT